jgi:hypothetical protein
LFELDLQKRDTLDDVVMKGSRTLGTFLLFRIDQLPIHACADLMRDCAQTGYQARDDQRSGQKSNDGHKIERIVNPKRVSRGGKMS